jgi:hypothetical protein
VIAGGPPRPANPDEQLDYQGFVVFEDPDSLGFVVFEDPDSLTLLFLCCHPALTPGSAIPLTLRACGG